MEKLDMTSRTEQTALALSIAVVCSSNMNRSMEAHKFLANKGFKVRSFGTGERVVLPGVTHDKPNVYEFGTSYEDISRDLKIKNRQFYTDNGILNMLDRNRRIKLCPERFQECSEQFDIIVTVEERIYDIVKRHIDSHKEPYNRMVHVINLDVEDSLDDALRGAFLITDLLNLLSKSLNLHANIKLLLRDFEKRRRKPIKHSVHFY